jgi:hypothetical protein
MKSGLWPNRSLFGQNGVQFSFQAFPCDGGDEYIGQPSVFLDTEIGCLAELESYNPAKEVSPSGQICAG